MNFTTFDTLVTNSFARRRDLLKSKGHDYATEDCLSNFKRMSQLCNLLKIDVTTPEGCNLFYILIKLDRTCNLLNKKEDPKNEAIEDTLDDMQNYIDLLRGLLKEDK